MLANALSAAGTIAIGQSRRGRILTDDFLFNCCPGSDAPDWSAYTDLQMAGCRHDLRDGVLSGQPATSAEFFSIYGLRHTGEADAITDCLSFTDLLRAACALNTLSGLPISAWRLA